MRILLLMDNPLIPTGYASTCRLTGRELINKGHEVYAMAFNGGPQPEEIRDLYGLKLVPNYATKTDPNNQYGNVDTILKIEAEIKPDIYFWHNDCYRYSYLQNLPQNIKEKSVFWLPFEGEYADPQGPMVFGQCQAVRFVTNHALKVNYENAKNMDHGVIPHAVDTSILGVPTNKQEAKRRKNLGIENKFVVVRVDRHQPRKFWSITIKAFAEFAKGKNDVFLLCKCNPRDITMWNDKTKEGIDLEALAISHGLTIADPKIGKEGNIFFDDFFFDNSFMPAAFYHPSDVFLTTTSGEGFGLTPAEAMACGLPIIYPNAPVLPEVVGNAGLKCEMSGKEWYQPLNIHYNVTNQTDVVNNLNTLYNDWKLGGANLAELSKNALQMATKYNHRTVYDQWDKLLRKIGTKKNLVSVITVLYNIAGEDQLTGPDGIQKLKDTLEQYVVHPYEWIIVDNGSPERELTRKWIEKAAAENDKIRPIFLDVNLGFAGAHNKAIELAYGDYVLLANPDSEAINPAKHGLSNDFIKIMFDRAQSDSNIGIVGMKLMRRDDVLKGSIFPYFCCTLLTKKCLEAIKQDSYFDERFWPAYYEDADVVMRAMSKGFKVVEQDVPFWHKSGGTNKHAIEGGKDGRSAKILLGELERIENNKILPLDFNRKRGEILANGMQGLIAGNISYLNSKWGPENRSKIKVCWHTHIGSAVGFSQIAEGLAPKLHEMGFDVYINDWSNAQNVENPVVAHLIEKTRRAKAEGADFDDCLNIICWLMETFADLDARYKVGISLCESTKVRESYLNLCNNMDRILTFSEFCRGVQKNSGFKVPIDVITPGVNDIYLNYAERPKNKEKFTFTCVGVSQGRKDTVRLVEAFCEAFPKGHVRPPECEDGFPLSCDQVELVIKSNNFGELNWIKDRGYDKRANVRAIFTGWMATQQGGSPDWTTGDMYNLYASTDCYVHPSHGEGIGMPILEAAATGCPVIFTEWSSPVEYLNGNNSYPCSLSPYPNTTLTPAYPGAPGDNGLWANIHIGHMKHLMYQVIRERQNSIAKGLAAHKHMKENFTWEESARKLMPLLFEWEEERKKKKPMSEVFDPETFVKPTIEPVREGDRVMVDVVTRDRHPYLACLMTSLLAQTFKNWDITIQIDDSDESVLKNHLIMSLLSRMKEEGHNWKMIRSQRQGPHMAHDRTLQMTSDDPGYRYKLICRIDDDIYVRPDFLEKLYGEFLKDTKCETSAVGGIFLDPRRSEADQMAPNGFETSIEYAGKIDHNVPWPYICPYPKGTPPREVEHLYSSFMYRVEVAKAIGGYCKLFSQIGHREESDFSYRLHIAGYKLFIQPEAIGFHFCAPAGGIRSESILSKEDLAMTDHKIYTQRLNSWKRSLAKKKANESRSSVMQADKKPFKILTVINAGSDADKINKSIEYFAGYSDEIYVTCSVEKEKVKGPKLASVAVTQDESIALTRAIMTEGDHDFIMLVNDSMQILMEPTELRASLSDSYDDYVFEVYKTYLAGNWNGMIFKSDSSKGIAIGPEVRNQCLITRKKKADNKPSVARTSYLDVMVLEDDKVTPVEGKSLLGNDIINLSDTKTTSWRKICTYQFPEGKLKEPRYLDIEPEKQDLVSIIIPTPGRRNLLKKCINSIFSHTKFPFEIIIIDNGSTDGTLEMLENEEMALPRGKAIKLIKQSTNLGYQKAMNIGIAKAKGNYILFFNDDAWVTGLEPDGRDWLSVYVDELKSNPKIGVVGPHEGTSPALGSKMLYFWCVMFRREVLEEVGPLDDVTFRNYGGDDDYCERLRNKGYEIKSRYTNLSHLMTCVPDEVKKPELEESRVKLIQKYGPRI